MTQREMCWRALSVAARAHSCRMASRAAALLLALVSLDHGVAGAGTICGNMSDFETMLAVYEREMPPPTAPLDVTLSLEARHAAVDERTSTIHLLADLKMSWRDDRLSWNTSSSGCDSVLVSAERLWLPDVVLLNAVASAGDTSLRARLTSSGDVSWQTRLDASVPVAMDLTYWPRDVQTALFIFGSREHTADELYLIIDDLKTLNVWESGAWEMVSLHVGVVRLRAGSRLSAEWALAVRRRAGALSAAAGAVLTAALLLLLAAGILPPLSRPPLAACAALSTAMWLITMAVRLPAGGACPRAVQALGGVCACAGAGAVAAAAVLRLARLPAPPPHALHRMLSALSGICRLTPYEGAAWSTAALLVDRVLLALLAVALLVLLCVYL